MKTRDGLENGIQAQGELLFEALGNFSVLEVEIVRLVEVVDPT